MFSLKKLKGALRDLNEKEKKELKGALRDLGTEPTENQKIQQRRERRQADYVADAEKRRREILEQLRKKGRYHQEIETMRQEKPDLVRLKKGAIGPLDIPPDTTPDTTPEHFKANWQSIEQYIKMTPDPFDQGFYYEVTSAKVDYRGRLEIFFSDGSEIWVQLPLTEEADLMAVIEAANVQTGIWNGIREYEEAQYEKSGRDLENDQRQLYEEANDYV